MAASSTELQLVLAKLGELAALIDALKANQGANTTSMIAQISDNVKREIIAELNKVKEKKKVTTGETKDGVSNAAPKKKTHPTLIVSEKSWALDEKGTTDFDKRVPWFIAVMNKHPEVMTNLLGDALIKEVEASESYLNNSATGRKDSSFKARTFFKSIKNYMIKKDEEQWKVVSKRLVDEYNKEKLVYDSTGLPQAKTEAAGSAEASAAAALMLSGINVPVTTTTTPAMQLANA